MSKEMLAGSSGSTSLSVCVTTAGESAHQNNESSSVNVDDTSVYQLKTLDVDTLSVDQLKTLSEDFIKKNGENFQSNRVIDLQFNTLVILACAAYKGHPEAMNTLAQSDCLKSLTAADLMSMNDGTLYWLLIAESHDHPAALRQLVQGDCLTGITMLDIKSMHKETLLYLTSSLDPDQDWSNKLALGVLNKLAQGDFLKSLTAADLKSMAADTLCSLAKQAYLVGDPEPLNKLAQGDSLKSLTAADLMSMNDCTLLNLMLATFHGHDDALNKLAQGDCLKSFTAADLKSMNSLTLSFLAKAACECHPEALKKLAQSDCLKNITMDDLQSMECGGHEYTFYWLVRAAHKGYPEALNKLVEGHCLKDIEDFGCYFYKEGPTIYFILKAALRGSPLAFRCLKGCIRSFVEEINTSTDSDDEREYDNDTLILYEEERGSEDASPKYLCKIPNLFSMVCEREALMGDDNVLSQRKLQFYLTGEVYKKLRSYLEEEGLCLALQSAQYLESQNDLVAAKSLLLDAKRISGECHSDKAPTKPCFLKNYMLARLDFIQLQNPDYVSITPEEELKQFFNHFWRQIKWLRDTCSSIDVSYDNSDDDYSEFREFMRCTLHWIFVIKLKVDSDWFDSHYNDFLLGRGILSICDSLDELSKLADFVNSLQAESVQTEALQTKSVGTQTFLSLFSGNDSKNAIPNDKKRSRDDCGGDEVSCCGPVKTM